MEAIRELGFEPNRMARGLRGAPSRLIGICFQELEAPVLAHKAGILLNRLRDHQYRGVLELTAGDQNLETAIIRHFLSMNVDGIILGGSTLHPKDTVVSQLRQSGIPVVTVDPSRTLPFAEVRLNRREAMASILRHLHERGHRKFALLGIESDDLYSKPRLEGLYSTASELGIVPERDFVSLAIPGYGLQDFRYGAALAEAFLKLPRPLPTGIIALNDRLAIAASRYLQESGYRIPEDFALTGFDNLDIASWSLPNLTTIDQNVKQIMGAAAQNLLQLIRGHTPETRFVEIQPRLIEGESTGNRRVSPIS